MVKNNAVSVFYLPEGIWYRQSFTCTEGFGIVNVTWEGHDISAFLIERIFIFGIYAKFSGCKLKIFRQPFQKMIPGSHDCILDIMGIYA